MTLAKSQVNNLHEFTTHKQAAPVKVFTHCDYVVYNVQSDNLVIHPVPAVFTVHIDKKLLH